MTSILKILPKIFVNLAAKVEDLVQGLAAALQSARERQRIPLCIHDLSGFTIEFCETTRLTPSACIETP